MHSNLREDNNVVNPGFWQDVAVAWSAITHYYPVNKVQVRNQPIWLNSYVRIQVVHDCTVNMIMQGFVRVGQLLNDQDEFIEFTELNNLSGGTISMMEYFAIIDVFRYRWKYILRCSEVIVKAEHLILIPSFTVADPGFPVGGGGRAPVRGVWTQMWALFGENVCKNERIGSHGGGVRRARPPRSANAL